MAGGVFPVPVQGERPQRRMAGTATPFLIKWEIPIFTAETIDVIHRGKSRRYLPCKMSSLFIAENLAIMNQGKSRHYESWKISPL